MAEEAIIHPVADIHIQVVATTVAHIHIHQVRAHQEVQVRQEVIVHQADRIILEDIEMHHLHHQDIMDVVMDLIIIMDQAEEEHQVAVADVQQRLLLLLLFSFLSQYWHR